MILCLRINGMQIIISLRQTRNAGQDMMNYIYLLESVLRPGIIRLASAWDKSLLLLRRHSSEYSNANPPYSFFNVDCILN